MKHKKKVLTPYSTRRYPLHRVQEGTHSIQCKKVPTPYSTRKYPLYEVQKKIEREGNEVTLSLVRYKKKVMT
jgi:hypothetical protein